MNEPKMKAGDVKPGDLIKVNMGHGWWPMVDCVAVQTGPNDNVNLYYRVESHGRIHTRLITRRAGQPISARPKP